MPTITLHNMLIIWMIQCSSIQYTPMKWMHHYLLQTPPHHVIIISTLMSNLNSSHENKSHITPSRGIHSKSKQPYQNVFGDANIQYHDFDNGDALTFTDKYTALLQQELQNPY